MSVQWLRELWPWHKTAESSAQGEIAAKKAPETKRAPFELEDAYSTLILNIPHLRRYIDEGRRQGRRWIGEDGEVADRDFGYLTHLLEEFEWIRDQFVAGVLRTRVMTPDQLRAVRDRAEEAIARTDALETELANEPPHQAAAVVLDVNDDTPRVLLVQHGPASDAPSGSYSLPQLPVDDFESPEIAAAAALSVQTGVMVNSDTLTPFEAVDEHLSVFYSDIWHGQLKAGSVVAPRWLSVNDCAKLESKLKAVIFAAIAAHSTRESSNAGEAR